MLDDIIANSLNVYNKHHNKTGEKDLVINILTSKTPTILLGKKHAPFPSIVCKVYYRQIGINSFFFTKDLFFQYFGFYILDISHYDKYALLFYKYIEGDILKKLQTQEWNISFSILQSYLKNAPTNDHFDITVFTKSVERKLNMLIPLGLIHFKEQKKTDLYIQQIHKFFHDRKCKTKMQHGDFSLYNIIKNKNNYYLIDWDEYGTHQNPVYDLSNLIIGLIYIYQETDDDINNAISKVKLSIGNNLDAIFSILNLNIDLFYSLFSLYCIERLYNTIYIYRNIMHAKKLSMIIKKIYSIDDWLDLRK